MHRLTLTWWIVWPLFTAVTGRLILDRACGDPDYLLPALTSDPRSAWPLALVYVAGHIWFVWSYLVVVKAAGTIVPSVSAIKTVWRGHLAKLLLMTAVFLLEYAPTGLWSAIGRLTGCR